jgi:peroxiredoxin
MLYESTLWNECLSEWISSYSEMESTIESSEMLINRVILQSPATLKPLIRDLCRILKNRNELQAAATIAAYPYGVNANERPDIAERLLTSALLPGTKAPAIEGMEQSKEKYTATILFFYESRCRSCQGMIIEMINKYSALQQKGVRIISLATDTNEQTFTEYSSRFLWPDKLCDYRGFDSPNMKNYGVAATPTLFLVDREGVVTDQYGTLEEIWNIVFEK